MNQKWNWQQLDWPNFCYESKALADLEVQFLKNSGQAFGTTSHLSDQDKDLLKIELISEEALKTSKIEGEILDQDSIQSSIRRQFGLKTDNRSIPPAEQGIATIMVNLYKTFNTPLSDEILWDWHKLLMNERSDIKDIGKYRTHKEPMQVISGPSYKPKIHFEAPPSNRVPNEMKKFIKWFNKTSPSGKLQLPAITRAGLAHLYFVSIHPFADGNGRIARAIAEKSLAQNLGYPTLIALAYTIERNRKDYYKLLEQSNKQNKITNWLVYFAQTTIDAQINTQRRIDFIIEKSKLYARLGGQLNQRQEKVLERMFREGIDGFKGGLSAKNYATITGAPRTTVTRDLKNLVDKDALKKTGEFKHTRYYLNLSS